jgi:hypothetical protein
MNGQDEYSENDPAHERRAADRRLAKMSERLGLLEYKVDQILRGQESSRIKVNTVVVAVIVSGVGVIINALSIHIH